jgi:hypothetical protein
MSQVFSSTIPAEGCRVITWSLVDGETGDAMLLRDTDGLAMAISLSGTFGGGSVAFEVSIDGTVWHALKDVQGNAVSGTAQALFEASTSALYIRPKVVSGTGVSVDASVLIRV